MYVGVDIGGTKTLVATLDDNGVILEQIKFPTSPDYGQFIKELGTNLDKLPARDEWLAIGVAAPGRVNHDTGIAETFGNLPWKNVPITADVKALTGKPVFLENDSNLAGLSEAMLHKVAERVLYITVSTGIGSGVIQDGRIEDPDNHSEPGHMLLPGPDGKLVQWESFASGHAIVERYGKRAADIEDAETWQLIARDLSLGFLELIAIVQPDLIVIGGSVGTYFDRFGEFLIADLKRFEMPLVPIPPIVAAERPETAVVYGCYDYAKYCLESGHGA